MPFRATRNAVVDSDVDDVEDLLEAVEEQVRQRRLECVVRLEHCADPDPAIRRILMDQLELAEDDVYEMPGLLEYRNLRAIASLPIGELRYKPWVPMVPPRLGADEGAIFDVIRAGDVLVHHPYDSFDASVLRFVREAVEDPKVLTIKMTLYRTGNDSPFIPLLIRAAESGKQVVCLVELKARFDEEENILLAKRMEKAGVHVVYGVPGLKTHTKTTLVVRHDVDRTRCYAHFGTGNYHYHTARLYVDLGLLTCREELTHDLVHLFNFLTGHSRMHDCRKLIVAPANMKRRFIEMIEREAVHHEEGRPARIIAKMNQLEDGDVCAALSRASRTGLPIDLVVRGFATMRPGVPGESESINIMSVIGRFLEHSRIFYFRNGAENELDGEFFIGSADWMRRNLENRVEAVTPIEEPALRRELWEILRINLSDRRSAWDMASDGSYTQRRGGDEDSPESLGTHAALMNRARKRE
jgi:polyphosphate kinase